MPVNIDDLHDALQDAKTFVEAGKGLKEAAALLSAEYEIPAPLIERKFLESFGDPEKVRAARRDFLASAPDPEVVAHALAEKIASLCALHRIKERDTFVRTIRGKKYTVLKKLVGNARPTWLALRHQDLEVVHVENVDP